jgi:uncharacterized membrane protein
MNARLAIASLAVVGFASAAHAQTVVDVFDVPNAIGTYPVAINAAGEIAGIYYDASVVSHGFVRTHRGNVTTFDPPGAGVDSNHETHVTALSPSGRAIGYFYDVADLRLVSHGFVREHHGAIVTFDAIPDAVYTVPTAINNDGEIAGYYYDANYEGHGFVRNAHGAITSFDFPGFVFNVTGIDHAGEIAGSYLLSDLTMRGFVRALDGTFVSFDAPGTALGTTVGCGHCHGTLATAIAGGGQVVGYYGGANNRVHGFVRRANGNIRALDVPNATNTFPMAMNAAGRIAGIYFDLSAAPHIFVRHHNGDVLSLDVPGSIAYGISGMNASGRFVGYYQDAASVAHAFIAR